MPADAYSPDDATVLTALEAEMPLLRALRIFASDLHSISWFCAIGEAMDADTHTLARDYIDALGFPDSDIFILPDWEDAIQASQTLDVNTPAWEAEEQLRASLTQTALTGFSEQALHIMLTHNAATLVEGIKDCAEEILYLTDAPDQMLDLLVGAAQQAAYNACLVYAAALAQAEDIDSLAEEDFNRHPLYMKFRLFAAGRWPISLTGRSFNLF